MIDYFQPYPYYPTQPARVVTLPIIPDFTIAQNPQLITFTTRSPAKWAHKKP